MRADDRRPFALPGATAQYGPDKTVDVVHIDLHLVPDLDTHTMRGTCTTTVEAIDDGLASLALDIVDLRIDAVRDASGAALAFTATSAHLTVTFAQPLAARARTTFAVDYRVEDAVRGLYFTEPDAAEPQKPRQAWTQSQDQDARAWFPCLDYPHGKQTTSTTIVVKKGEFALGNGALTERRDDGATTIFRYEQNVPHSTYLVTMVVGRFAEIEQRPAPVPTFYYVPFGREADGERAFGKTPQMIEAFAEITGQPYPYARYSQIAVADFIFGGMENTSATTQMDRILFDERASLDFTGDWLVSHELAHQWFGDLLTCRDWSHAWLNEGFATYFEALWLERDRGWDEYLYDIIGDQRHYVSEDGDRYRRPIVCNRFRDPIELFDGHLYQKGGAVLHMLRGHLGWERMQRSLKRYVADNAQRNVETIDLVRAVENATGRNIRGFVAQYVERGGHPELEVGYRYDKDRGVAIVTVTQKQTIDAEHPAYDFDLVVGLVADASDERAGANVGDGPMTGETRATLRITRAVESFAIPVAAEPTLVRVDPGGYVIGTMSYTFDADMLAAILRRDASIAGRSRAATALGKKPGRVAREALADALAHDAFWGVAADVAGVLGGTYAPASRATLLANVGHAHPKVRRAIASALGNFRDAEVASALLALRDDPSYYVVGAALLALGKTRDPRAFDALVAALDLASYGDVIAASAARGLGELAEARALDVLAAATRDDRREPIRRAALAALARAGTLLEHERTRVVEAIRPSFGASQYFVRLSAYTAAEALGDARLLGELDRASVRETDGRLRRSAAEAAIRVRESQSAPAELARLRTELDELRDDHRKMRERLDELTPRA
jgi:aminopeptidase N